MKQTECLLFAKFHGMILYALSALALVIPVALTAALLLYEEASPTCQPSIESELADCAPLPFAQLIVLSLLSLSMLLWGVRAIERLSETVHRASPAATREAASLISLPTPRNEVKTPVADKT